ncbi:MAG: hypothetical protein ACOYNY_25035 [Caldilineaceae bacterium]|jgi:hypothetical protein
MNQRQPAAHSYLFTVRIWWEDLGQGQREWRGVVKLVTSGEEHFFRDWVALGQLLAGMVGEEAALAATMSEEAAGD